MSKINNRLINNPFSTHPNAKAPIKTVVREYRDMGTKIMKSIAQASQEIKTAVKVKHADNITTGNVVLKKKNRPTDLTYKKRTIARVELTPVVNTNKKDSVILSDIQKKALRADSAKLSIKELMSKYNVSMRTVYRILEKKVA